MKLHIKLKYIKALLTSKFLNKHFYSCLYNCSNRPDLDLKCDCGINKSFIKILKCLWEL